MVITAEPLLLKFVNAAGEVVVVLNDNGQLVVEPLKVKKERIDDDDANIVEVVSVLLCLFCFYNREYVQRKYYQYILSSLSKIYFWRTLIHNC